MLPCPVRRITMKRVIDLSSHNQIPYDWSAVKYSVDGVILRCGYRGYSSKGSLVIDKRFRQFQRACEQFGIPYGVYFFPTSISIAEAVEEADFVLNLLEGAELSFPIFADSEMAAPLKNGRSDRLSKEDRTTFLIAFLERLKAFDKDAGIYASTSWYKDRLIDEHLLKYPHWVAQYSHECTYPGSKLAWQYTSKEQIPGIGGRVDCSYWYDEPTIRIAFPVLKRGRVGAEVRYLQDNLIRCGYELEVDGHFGPATEAALISWQIAHDLVGDGAYGPKSFAKMKEVLGV